MVFLCTLPSLYKAITAKRLLVVYHHPCSDGSLSAALFQAWIDKHGDAGVKATFVGHYHSQPWGKEWAEAGVDLDEIDMIVFLDVCPTYAQAAIMTQGHPLLIMDHHEGLQADLFKMVEDGLPVQAVYSDVDSGASITWVVTSEDTYTPEWTERRYTACPPLVRIVRARDLWRFGEDEALGTEEEVKGMAEALYATTPTTPSAFEDRLYQAEAQLLEELRSNARMARAMLDLYCEKLSKEVLKARFRDGLGLDSSLRFYTCNCPHFLTSVMGEWLGSHGFDDVDFYLLWAKNDAKATYGTSLRTHPGSGHDLSALAKQMESALGGSGGGHVRAAGHRLPPGKAWDDVVVSVDDT